MTKQIVPAEAVENGEELTRGHKKKARTRQQLLDAALRIYARKGAGELALNELAEEAGVANGTVYNYFRTREEVLDAVGIALAEQLSQQIIAASVGISRGAERMAIGVRRFVLQAIQDPAWARALISVARYADGMVSALGVYVRADLQAGEQQGDFKVENEDVALELVLTATMGAMVAAVEGRAVRDHDRLIAGMILMALGVEAAEAKHIASLPVPPVTEGDAVINS